MGVETRNSSPTFQHETKKAQENKLRLGFSE